MRDGRTYYFCSKHCRERFLQQHEATPDTNKTDESQHRHPKQDDPEYVCPMCEGVTHDEPGECPKCGMALEPKRPERSRTSTVYTCPMHPEVEQDEPGACPKCGMDLEPKRVEAGKDDEDRELRRMSHRFWWGWSWACRCSSLPCQARWEFRLRSGFRRPLRRWLQFALSTPVVLWAGWPFFQRGWRSVVTWNLNMFTLIALGTGAAYFYSVVAVLVPNVFPASFRENGHVAVYFEAATMITVLVLLGQVLELRARRRTAGAIRELMSLAPPTARVVRDGEESEVSLGRSEPRRRVAGPARREGPRDGKSPREEAPSTNP